MTQILAAINMNCAVVAADRRLTWLRAKTPPKLADDNATKVVLLEDKVAFAYTGLANLRPGGRSETHWWLMNVLDPMPASLDQALRTVEQRATNAFKPIPDVAGSKRHAFVATGWGFDTDSISARPFIAKISNALDHSGSWRDSPQQAFETRVEWLRAKKLFRFGYAGQPLRDGTKRQLIEDLGRPKNQTPGRVATLLARAIRATAKTNLFVGRGLLVTVLPRPSENSIQNVALHMPGPGAVVDDAGDISFPEVTRPISFHVPADDSEVSAYGPPMVTRGAVVAHSEFQFHNSYMTDEEVERYYAPLIERFKRGGP
jgi:hypothetical protein